MSHPRIGRRKKRVATDDPPAILSGNTPELAAEADASAAPGSPWEQPVGLALLSPVESGDGGSAPGSTTRSTEGGGAQPEEAQARARTSDPPRTIRVLLADDHKLVRQGLVGLLAQASDIEIVAEAADGQQAVELSQQHRPRVVIMDVSMPRMDGIEATRHILQAQPNVNVVGLSMYSDQSTDSAMREAGACEFLSKGGPIEDLIAAIRKCASGDE